MNNANDEQGRDLHYAAVKRVLVVVLVFNLLITIIKIILGLVSGALAVVADGFHSLVDSSSNLVGLAAIRLAGRPADDDHPYGYRRYETLGALAIGGMLLVAAWEIGSAIVDRFSQGSVPEITQTTMGLIALTLPINVLIVVLETRAAKRLNSEILLADAKHTMTDLYVTASVIFSLFGVWLGWAWLDMVVAGVVVVMILRAAFTVLGDTAKWLADANVVDASTVEGIARGAPGVRYVHRVRSRGTRDSAFVDLHVKVDPGMSTSQAHAIASEVERRLVAEMPTVSDALVHIEPAQMINNNPWGRMANDMRHIADGMGLGLHDLHIHMTEEGGYTVELHLEMSGEITLGEAHNLADEFETKIKQRWSQAEQIITHLEPVQQVVFLPDDSPDPQYEASIRDVLATTLGPEEIGEVLVYHYGGHLGVAVKVFRPASLSLAEAHASAEQIEVDLVKQVPGLQRVTLHIEPEHGE
ncbi:MAG: cation-efflux pump [Anaerolineae bacterium]|nr:cation-efflux pump [Anaerolineae bacterium]